MSYAHKMRKITAVRNLQYDVDPRLGAEAWMGGTEV